jgi:nickel-type superoxide dismutase maturation protease
MSGILNVTILGDSMYPTLTDGQTISAEILHEFDDVRIGDIVVLLHPFKPETHIVKRIKSFDGVLYFVEGDQPDPLGSEDSHNFGPIARDLILARIQHTSTQLVAPEFIEVKVCDMDMYPRYNVDDVIIAHVLDSIDEIQIGDVVVLNDPEINERKLVRKVENIDGQHFFVTSENKEIDHPKDSYYFGTISRDKILAIIDEEAQIMVRA